MNELGNTSRRTGWLQLVLFAGMMLFAFYGSTHMVAAGDTWVAMACGRHFAHHGVDTIEPFSFNSHPAGPSDEQLQKFPAWSRSFIRWWHPTGWINQNWLTHLIYYKLAVWFGSEDKPNYNVLVIWKFALYFLTVFSVYGIGKLLGAGNFLSAAAACMGMVVGRTFFDIRPAGYSNLLVPVYILVLALATYRNWRLIWLMIPLIVFWANVHGGYIYAFIMFVPFIGIHFLLNLPRRWTVSLGCMGLWLVLYLMIYKFLTNDYYVQTQKLLNSDYKAAPFISKMLAMWGILAAGSVILAAIKTVKPAPFYAYHIGVGFIWFLSLCTSFFARIPVNLTPQFKTIYSSFVSSSQLSFCFVFIAGTLLVFAMAVKKERFVILPVRGLIHTIGAAVCSFIAMVILNPFHLTNLTHTFEISVSKHAESWRQVNEWKPAFDWMDKTSTTPNPVGEEEAFAVLCILTGLVLLAWLSGYFLKPQLTIKGSRKSLRQECNLPSGRPRIDLAIIVLSLLTLYMAVQSRRFIALAGSAAAPAVFLLARQAWQMITAKFNLKIFSASDSSNFRIVSAGYIVLSIFLALLGLFWAIKFKRVYLDPWPTDNRYHSIFMRMTASHLKPFEVCQFININNLRGRVFNYWTEGGAIAFGQQPDKDTGQIPLKLFMDGRAQAAYNHDKFRLWQLIHGGGPIAQQALAEGRKLTAEQLREVGLWIDKQLKSYQVWVVLMPQSQEDSTFMQALKLTPNWKTGYLDNTQHLLVDIENPDGRNLIDNILNNKAGFPDSFSQKLTTSVAILENQYAPRFGDLYELTKGAFDEYPYPAAALALNRLTGLAQFREQATSDLQTYLDDFTQNQEMYKKENGFLLRLGSAEIAARCLMQIKGQEKDRYRQFAEQFRELSKLINTSRIW
ncbi:MAG TPA: hypothetical protein PK052_06735 [Anaerohalosphaeraceae bacterium]|nr:hypothetical protein [Anaerohalosphaeraceae bacterium]HOL31663.1 hypothetical protein [Anaerohalosphaeraceae bacterium]HOM75388.1 hypothetical protein [Anaerohalosphaeraceae bacterium]HPC64880.1 hypothetical protein [Anaerohalosphaeraceae bacterium]HPO70616.1 hypothetical protein [Anaerohalosphaeraceae bacterium]